jgi:hypothetical protein
MSPTSPKTPDQVLAESIVKDMTTCNVVLRDTMNGSLKNLMGDGPTLIAMAKELRLRREEAFEKLKNIGK